MTEYCVKVFSHTYTTDPCESGDDPWKYRGTTAIDASVASISRSEPTSGFGWDRVSSESTYSDGFYGIDDIPPGGTAYVVLCNYQTGDTFGSDGAYCIAAIVDSPEKAREVEGKCHDENDRPGSCAYRPFDGYFEHLNDVSIHPLIVLA